MDSRSGASFGVVGSSNAVWGVKTAVLPSSCESKLRQSKHDQDHNMSYPRRTRARTRAPLNEDKLVGLHPAHILPPVPRVVLHAERLPVAVGVLQRGRHEVVRAVDGAVVAERERPVERGVVDGPPEVDDLETAREQLGDVVRGEMAADARDGRLLRLVDMYLRHGLALLRRVFDLARAPAADR